MADCRKISKQALLEGLRAHGAIFAPDAEGVWTDLAGDALPEVGEIRPKRPLRDLFIPPIREIGRFKTSAGAQPELVPAVVDRSPGAVFGVRPCDARALAWLDHIFLAEPYVDPHYKAKRENLLLIGLACQPASSCHCGVFDYGPDDPAHMDLMLHPAGEDFVAVAGSERGSAFLGGLKDTQEAEAPTPRDGAKPDWWTGLPDPKEMLAAFDHPVWEALQVGCMNCGACTLYCPTCQCFTITDERYKDEVQRLRVVDTCQRSDFTRMAGGHNPRQSNHPRLRQRVMHKFAYIPDRNDGALGCTGCGRCVELCGLNRHLFADLVEIKKRLSEESSCGT